MVNLIRKSDTEWTVIGEGGKTFVTKSIETAAHMMVHIFKVQDDEIDEALIEMYGHNRSKAIFNSDGYLVETVDT